VTSIEVEREQGLTVVFDDDRTCRFGLLELRENCPCAACRSLRDRGEPAWPRPGGPTELRVENAELVGGWGLGVTWNDGHATGIYPWDALRAWCDEREEDRGRT
jgi:DUF971 family protein